MKQSKWSTIRHVKWFVPVVVVLSVLLIGGGVYAATFSSWQSAKLTGASGVGSILTVTPVANNFDWEIGSTAGNVEVITGSGTNFMIKFAPVSAAPGGTFTTTATLNITNSGNVNITGWNVTGAAISTQPTIENVAITTSSTPIAAGSSGRLTLTLTGTAPALSVTGNVYDLGGATCTLTPTGP